MSIARNFLNEFRPLFRMLEEPITRSPAIYGSRPRSLFDDPFFQSPAFARPSVDVTEEGDKYILEAELPGVKKDNVEVRIGDGGRSVTIEGKILSRRRPENQSNLAQTEQAQATTESTANEGAVTTQPENTNQISTERSFVGNSMFTRTVWLPRPVDSDNVAAKLDDGILTITVPKAQDKASVVVPVQ